MLLKQLVLDAEKNNKNSDTYTRYIIRYHEGLKKPIVIELKTGKNNLDINIFDTNVEFLTSLKNYMCEENIKSYVEKALYGKGKESLFGVKDKPVTQLSASVMNGFPIIQHVETRHPYRRKGLATLAMYITQDYYAKRPEGFNSLYSCRGNTENLVYENKLESKLGSFGEVLAYTKAKILKKNRGDLAFVRNFLGRTNHFYVEDSPYAMPRRKIRKRNLINGILVDEKEKPSAIQVCGEVMSTSMIDKKFTPPDKDISEFFNTPM